MFRSGSVVFWLFGILLPAVAIIIEADTHMCANVLFDPLPNWWQFALVTLVPTANLATWFSITSGRISWLPRLAHLNAFALGVSVVYAAMFLQFTPFAVLGLLYFGFGLLPLTPLISVLTLAAARGALRRSKGTAARFPKIWIGFAAGIVVLAAPYTHDFLTHELLARAASKDAAENRRGVALLRTFGSHKSLLRFCYDGNDWNFFAGGWGRGAFEDGRAGNRIPTEDAQAIYYRVTGEPYNSLPAPEGSPRRGIGRGMWNFDSALGGTQVAGKVPGLSMQSSRLDGKVEAAAGTSYVEWTMVFKNIARNQSEARAQIELPPGAAVSRLTLWIDGEPREAAFGARGTVRAAYQQVAVQQRRDPVLVTTSGPDRVLMQCFPVQPDGGEMKIRIGITAPLRLTGERQGTVLLPRFLETNFEQEDAFAHDVWLESDQPLDGTAPTARLRLREKELQGTPGFRISLPEQTAERWTDDPTDPGFLIRQTVRRTAPDVPRRVVFVLDGSKAMASELPGIADVLQKMSAGSGCTMVFASDEPEVFESGGDIAKATAWLRSRKPAGGRDNLPALERAWDLAATEPGGAIVWLHGPQPVLLASAEPLLQRTERERTPPVLYDLAHGAGLNRIIEKLDRFPGIRSVRANASLAGNLEHLLALWRGDASEFSLVRERLPRAGAAPGPATESRHIARLWGLAEIERLAGSAEPGGLDKAVKLALQFQLVTRVSGAVVLERKEQYDRAGLTPADPQTVPIVPEPGSVLLLLLGGGTLLLRRRR